MRKIYLYTEPDGGVPFLALSGGHRRKDAAEAKARPVLPRRGFQTI